MPPSGALNRCRLYIPARVMWGAFTAEITRSRIRDNPDNIKELYKAVGAELKEKVRFSYLYPAEHFVDGWLAWLPRYESGKGLSWRIEGRNDNARNMSDRMFRSRLLNVRPGTAIDPGTNSAADGTLHETECIQPYWRDGEKQLSFVAMAGYVFVKSGDPLLNEVKSLFTIFVGGDTRYGLGHLNRVDWGDPENAFAMPVGLDHDDFPIVVGDRVLAHAVGTCRMKGALELLAVWDRLSGGRLQPVYREPLWVPGSACANPGEQIKRAINANGIWQEQP